MRYTELLDCNDNMIFEGDILAYIPKPGSHMETSNYYVGFGYYTSGENRVYGFYLKSQAYGSVHDMPEPDDLGRLKLHNVTRGE